MEDVLVPSNDMVEAYFTLPTAETLMPPASLIQGAAQMNLTSFLPHPTRLGPIFLGFQIAA
jgi:hypothetical protein